MIQISREKAPKLTKLHIILYFLSHTSIGESVQPSQHRGDERKNIRLFNVFHVNEQNNHDQIVLRYPDSRIVLQIQIMFVYVFIES